MISNRTQVSGIGCMPTPNIDVAPCTIEYSGSHSYCRHSVESQLMSIVIQMISTLTSFQSRIRNAECELRPCEICTKTLNCKLFCKL